LDFGYGLTNLIAKPTAGIQDLVKQDFLRGRQTLVAKIKKYQPVIVAVLGISVARVLFPSLPSNAAGKRIAGCSVQTGLLPVVLAGVRVFVLPNPSGRNAHYSYQNMKDLFSQLKVVSLQSPLSVMN
jgi:TDG/mug DNA glycosylase family protein